MTERPAPVLQSLLLADHVYRDALSGKHVVCGIFNTYFITNHTLEPDNEKLLKELVHAPQSGSPFVYLGVTEFNGEREFELRWVSLDDHQVFLDAKFTLHSNDPTETVEACLQLPKLPLKATEDVYALELLCDDTLLGAHRVKSKFST